MYSVTWIRKGKLKTVTTPSWESAFDLFAALRLADYCCRFWGKDNKLIA